MPDAAAETQARPNSARTRHPTATTWLEGSPSPCLSSCLSSSLRPRIASAAGRPWQHRWWRWHPPCWPRCDGRCVLLHGLGISEAVSKPRHLRHAEGHADVAGKARLVVARRYVLPLLGGLANGDSNGTGDETGRHENPGRQNSLERIAQILSRQARLGRLRPAVRVHGLSSDCCRCRLVRLSGVTLYQSHRVETRGLS